MLFVVIGVPILEIIVAILVAHAIGWGLTLIALIALSLVGVWQVKVQGLTAWRTATNQIGQGSSPGLVIIEGALRVLGAVLLVLPGFCTALVGGLLLIAAPRRAVAARGGEWVVGRFTGPVFVRTTRHGSYFTDDIVDVDGWEGPAAVHDRSMLEPPRM